MPHPPEHTAGNDYTEDDDLFEHILRDPTVGAWMDAYGIHDVRIVPAVKEAQRGARALRFEGKNGKNRPMLSLPLYPDAASDASSVVAIVRQRLWEEFSGPPNIRTWVDQNALGLDYCADHQTNDAMVFAAVAAYGGSAAALSYQSFPFSSNARNTKDTSSENLREWCTTRRCIRETVTDFQKVLGYWWRGEDLHIVSESVNRRPLHSSSALPTIVVRESLRQKAREEFDDDVRFVVGAGKTRPARSRGPDAGNEYSVVVTDRYGRPCEAHADQQEKLFGRLRSARATHGTIDVELTFRALIYSKTHHNADHILWTANWSQRPPGEEAAKEWHSLEYLRKNLHDALRARLGERHLTMLRWSSCRVDTAGAGCDFALVWDARVGAFEEKSLSEFSTYLRQLLKEDIQAVFLHVSNGGRSAPQRQRCIVVHISFLRSKRG